MSLIERARHRLAQGGQADAGFTLTEVIVSLVLIAIVMTAGSYFFIVSLHAQTGTKQRQEAVYLADQQLEAIQALPGKQLIDGRTQSSVQTLLASSFAPTLTADDITNCPTSSTCNYDPTATGSSTPNVTTSWTTNKINGVNFTIQSYIDPCYRATSSSASCGTSSSSGSQVMYRATVNAYWTAGAGEGCGASACNYSASTLIDPDSKGDPTFNSNISHPLISGVSPSTIAVGRTATLTITGSQFLSGATVSIDTGGGTLGSITSNSGTQIVVPFTASSTATPGSTYAIYVTNPDGGRTTGYTITLVANPTISVSPSSVASGSTTSITITGTDLENGATLTAARGNISSLNIQSSTRATATYTAPTTSGTDTFTWTNAAATDDQGVATATETVTQSLPTVTGVNTSGALVTGGASRTVTLTGTNFASGLTVGQSNSGLGTISSVSVTSGTSLTFTYTPSTTASGLTKFYVVNPDGGTSGYSPSVAVNPTISSLSPTSTTPGTRTTITLTGKGFASGLVVTASSGTVNSYAYTNSTTATVTFTSSSSGSVTFTLTNSDGTSATSPTFTVGSSTPSISSVSPTSILAGTTKSVTVSGSNLSSLTGASWSGGSCSVTSSSSSSATLSCTAGSTSGTFGLTVRNAAGTSGSVNLAVTASPNVTALCSNTSYYCSTTFYAGSYDTFYVRGTNFQSGAQVTMSYYGSTLYSGTASYDSSSQLHFGYNMPNYPGTYTVTITVTNPDGGTDSGNYSIRVQ